MIYTTNAVESLNMSLRKIIKMRGSFSERGSRSEVVVLGVEKRLKKMDEAGTGLACCAEPLQHSLAGSYAGVGACVTVCAGFAQKNSVKGSCENDGVVESHNRAFRHYCENVTNRDSHVLSGWGGGCFF